LLYSKVAEAMVYFYPGDWDKLEEYDDNLINLNVRIGELFYASSYIFFAVHSCVERGYPLQAEKIINKIYEVGYKYENNYAIAMTFWVRALYFFKYRKFPDALRVSEEAHDFTNKAYLKAMHFITYSYKARVQMLLGNMKGAEHSLRYLNKIKAEINFPSLLSPFMLNQFILEIYRLQNSIKSGRRTEFAQMRKRVFKSGKKMVKHCRKTAYERVETFKLVGVCRWLTGQQKKALKWWRKSITEGERLGARLELSRTYMEVGKRLLEKKSRYKELNGIGGPQYLEKAKTMFMDMKLEWDLEKLEELAMGA
jgi:tetratricopeptide (TPR) repeat protein